MAVRRHYIEVTDVAGSTAAQIALAEELIDQYVGHQDRHIQGESYGEVTGAVSKTVYDTSNETNLNQVDNYFARCVIEIIGGTGVGQIRPIVSSDKEDHSITYDGDVFSPALDGTSIFKIYQLAKFPRKKDVYGGRRGDNYSKSVPQLVKEAVIAQTEFIISQGDDFFGGISSDMESERIGNYSYTRGNSSGSSSALVKMIAPKARTLLRGIKNSGGRIVVGSDSWE